MSKPRQKVVLSVFGIRPNVVGGLQSFASELSAQLCDAGWKSVLAFLSPPTDQVASLFDLPNTHLEWIEFCGTRSMRAISRTGHLIRKYRPDIAHFHLVDPILYPWLARSLGVGNVFLTDHISRPQGFCPRHLPAWKRMAKRLAYAPVTKIICVSDFVRDCRRTEGVSAEHRTVRIYNGVDISRAHAGADKRAEFRRRYRIPGDHVVILQVSWLIPEKGVDDLVHAAHLIRKKTDKFHVLVAGDGPRRHEYETLAEELGIADRVTFLGNVSDPLGEGLFAASDIVCQLSHWEEAFGLTIAEAMASGKAVIGTRVGAIPELIADGETGYLVDRPDVANMAEKILSLVNDGRLRNAFGSAGMRICQERFNMTANVAALIDHYGILGQRDED